MRNRGCQHSREEATNDAGRYPGLQLPLLFLQLENRAATKLTFLVARAIAAGLRCAEEIALGIDYQIRRRIGRVAGSALEGTKNGECTALR